MRNYIGNMEPHDFYCLKCGNKNYTLFRKKSRLRETFHRKTLYCPHCRKSINHIETKNEGEAFDFKESFLNGEFKEEANKYE